MQSEEERRLEYRGIAYKLAQEYLPYTDNAVDLDDLLQACAVGAVRADASFDPSKGTWYNWCAFYMRQEMQTLCGFRTSKVDASRNAASLDEPITEDGGTLADVLADEAPTPEEDWDRAAVASVIRERVDGIRPDLSEAVKLVDFEGKTLPEAAEEMGVSYSALASLRRKAYTTLRRDHIMQGLAELSGMFDGKPMWRL